MRSVVDFPALAISILIALVITVALLRAQRNDNNRRGWITAGVLAAVLIAFATTDLLIASPRETHLAAGIVGPIIPVLGALGMIRGTRGVRMRIRGPVVFLTTYVLLFAGLLIGATLAPRFL